MMMMMMMMVITVTLIDPIWLMGVAWDACSHGALRPNRVPTVRDWGGRQPLHCQKSIGDRDIVAVIASTFGILSSRLFPQNTIQCQCIEV